MNLEKVYVTQQGYEDLLKEYETLVHVTRKDVIEELQAARAQGDLSENADYDAARDRQARIEGRIREVETMLNNIEIIDDKKSSKVIRIGSTFTMCELVKNSKGKLVDGDTERFTIVGSVEADPLNGKLSNVSPLAQAILDRKEGDVATVNIDQPYEVKILSIE
jgi:transcription elongation factor GreA